MPDTAHENSRDGLFPRTVAHILGLAALTAFVLAMAGFAPRALAQGAGGGAVAPQLFENSFKMQGDTIRFCIDDYSTGAAFDRAVANAIADALLVKAIFVPAPTGFPIDGTGYLDELELTMAKDCDVLVGISMTPGAAESPFPDWATVTRPYAQVPFVLVVKDPAFKSLGDIPGGKTLGGPIGSLGLGAAITYNQQQPAERRLRYLPYGDPKLMLKRLLDGSLSGMIIWQPQLNLVTDRNPAALGLRNIPLSPMKPVITGVGNLVAARDSYLRSSIDQAIGHLVGDGTIARLMKENGYEGVPGP